MARVTMTPTSIRTSAVVISYNVAPLLHTCLQSLEQAAASGELDEIVVIDSSSSDNSIAMIMEEFGRLEPVVVPNRGYGAAANRGVALSSGDAILILNPDTVVEPGAIFKLKNALFSSNRMGIVGPCLLYPDGSQQSTCRRFPRFWTPLFESSVFEEWLPGNRWVRDYRMAGERAGDASGNRSVDWLVGAALMVKREMFEDAGGFDESFFLYGEELEWCYRVRRHGWDVQFVPDATIIHHESASIGQNPQVGRLEFDRGRIRAQRKIHGRYAALGARAMIRLNYAVQLVRESLKWLVGHRRPMRGRRIQSYWGLMKSDLDG